MKVSIIGGGGRVGSDAAYALQLGGKVNEIVLIDANQDMAAGEALDLLHGSHYSSSQTITSGGYDAASGSNCVVITAGLRRGPDETRLQLINRNVGLFQSILGELKNVKLAADATILVVSNPVDILTQLAMQAGIVPATRTLGLGTVLDTCRFCSLLADKFKVGATDVNALILGEHGDSMVPIWSSANIAGVCLNSIPGFSQEVGNAVFDFTKKSGAEVIRMKGGAGRAVGIAIKEVVEAIGTDSRKILPVSVLQTGCLGIKDVCLSMPTVVGRAGAISIMEPAVTDAEKEALHASAKSLTDTFASIG